jgi:hypothetical protein
MIISDLDYKETISPASNTEVLGIFRQLSGGSIWENFLNRYLSSDEPDIPDSISEIETGGGGIAGVVKTAGDARGSTFAFATTKVKAKSKSPGFKSLFIN